MSNDRFKTISLTPKFQIRIIDDSHIFEQYENQVEEIWKFRTNKKLHNGVVFHTVSVNEKEIIVSKTSYKYFFAQLQNRNIFEGKLISPLAITARIRANNAYILGQRSSYNTQEPGMIEFVPSGSFDQNTVSGNSLDSKKLVLQEAIEEIGLYEENIKNLNPCFVVLDQKDNVWDLIYDLELNLSEEEIKKRFKHNKNNEIDRLIFCYDYKIFLNQNKNKISELSQFLIEKLHSF